MHYYIVDWKFSIRLRIVCKQNIVYIKTEHEKEEEDGDDEDDSKEEEEDGNDEKKYKKVLSM